MKIHNFLYRWCWWSYLLTPWRRVLLEKLTGLQLVKKFPAFQETRRFITALTSVRHLSLSWASPIQSIYPHPTSWSSILILFTHLRLGLPSGLFPSGFHTKTLYAPLSSPVHATCPAHLILLNFITCTILGEEYRSFSNHLVGGVKNFKYMCSGILCCVCDLISLTSWIFLWVLICGLVQVLHFSLAVNFQFFNSQCPVTAVRLYLFSGM